MKSLFGTNLFGFRKPAEPMYDFATNGLLNSSSPLGLDAYTQIEEEIPDVTISEKLKERARKQAEKPKATPKALFEMKALHNQSFGIKTDPAYLQEQMQLAQEKLALLGKKPTKKRGLLQVENDEYGVKSYTRQELESIIERLKNRFKINSVKNILDKYPHTTSEKITEVINAHSNLSHSSATGFISDFPKEAINSMTEYDAMCEKLCGKKSVYYVIIEKKDSDVQNKRRDPILLAQSPFGFFWQILGAWDKEMVYLGDL